MSGRRQSRTRAAFTLVEVLIVVSIFVLVSYNLYTILGSTTRSYRSESIGAELDNLARRTVDRIALALIGSRRETLYTTPESPMFTSSLTYEENLGWSEEQIVWSDQRRIALALVEDKVVWIENPGEPNERSVVWCNWVRHLLEGEVENGIDDNGNGLVDERGLSFDVDGDSIIIRLTLERAAGEGDEIRIVTTTVTARVTCRN